MRRITPYLYALLLAVFFVAPIFGSLAIPATADAAGSARICSADGSIVVGGSPGQTCATYNQSCINGICQSPGDCVINGCPNGYGCVDATGGKVCAVVSQVPGGGAGSGSGGTGGGSSGIPSGINTSALARYAADVQYAINSVIVPVLFAIAFLVFLWGVFKYFIWGGDSEDSRSEGKKLVFWGVIGFAIILSVWGLVNVVLGTFGLRAGGAPPKYPLL